MSRYQVILKKIVSADGRVVAEAKSIAKTSVNGKSEIIQNVLVTTCENSTENNSSSCSVQSVSSSSSQSISIS